MNKVFSIEARLAGEVLTSRDASGRVRLYREGHFIEGFLLFGLYLSCQSGFGS